MHTHAGQVAQRADRVSETGRGVGGAGLSGSALGNVGAQTAAGHQQFVSRAQQSIGRAGQGLQGQSSRLRQTGDNYSNTESENQRRFSGIDPNSPSSRTAPAGTAPGMPSASGSGSGGRRPQWAYHNQTGTGYAQAGQNAFDQYYPSARPGWQGRPDNLGGRVSAQNSSAHNPYVPQSATQQTPQYPHMIDPNGPGPSVHAGYGAPVTQSQFLATHFPNHGQINPNYGTQQGYGLNCNQSIVGVDAMNAGHPVTGAPPMTQGTFAGTQYLQGRYNGTETQNTNYGHITQTINQQGGAGVVYVSRTDGTAHVFNVVHHPQYGAVYLDGQTGRLGNLEPTVAQGGNVDNVNFMHYFPDYQPNQR